MYRSKKLDVQKFNRLQVYGYKVYHSLLRSKARRKSIIFLENSSEELEQEAYKTTIFDVSKNIDMSYHDVKAAIVGEGKGYKKDESLVSLGLVAFEKIGFRIVYYLTEKGREVAKVLKELL